MPDPVDVIAGVVALALGVVVARRFGRPSLTLPLSLLLTVIALVVLDYAPLPTVIAAGTGLLLSLPQRHRLIPVYAGTVALLLAGSELPDSLDLPRNATAVVVASMAAAAGLAWLAVGRLGGSPAWVLVAASACAVYVAVPDTEQITVVAAAAVVGSLALSADSDDTLAPAPAVVAVLAALVVWCAAWGAIGRPASFVSGPGAVAPIAVVVAVLWRGTLADWRSREGATIVAGHLVVATVLARTAGLETSLDRAVWIAVVVVTIGGSALALLTRRCAKS